MRTIEVGRCHPYECPWCTQGESKKVYYCEAVSGLKIRAVKTFPKVCPLREVGRFVEVKCSHPTTIRREELNCHPYGHDCTWEQCVDCGKKFNFKVG